MSLSAEYRAIPYEPLLARAMVDRDFAEALQFFGRFAAVDAQEQEDITWRALGPAVRQVMRGHPGILDRTFSTQAWDAVLWLLSASGGRARSRFRTIWAMSRYSAPQRSLPVPRPPKEFRSGSSARSERPLSPPTSSA
ncbi:hypothetical protein [Allokutzneria sp. NRRL B-24872]|uniref:hypothetical protein n=1 Tax=Allokutzneria sp. NRRL B-24872 TaxID=1137961 RepID=UPI000A3A93E3|nr:hypothetical protein [Allokutzneria sp. NRRL B-24872]